MDIYQILVTHNREWTAREFLFFAIVFIVVAFCLRQLVKRDKMKGFQAYACLAALTFLAIVYASTVFTRNPQTDYHYNLDLFWSWRAVFRGSREMLKEDILWLTNMEQCHTIVLNRTNRYGGRLCFSGISIKR